MFIQAAQAMSRKCASLSFTYEETGSEGTPCPGEGTQDQAGVSAFPGLVDPRKPVASLLGKTPEVSWGHVRDAQSRPTK